jgi:hypothetical protein
LVAKAQYSDQVKIAMKKSFNSVFQHPSPKLK